MTQTLQPLPQAILTAAKLRRQARELLLLADELEASAEVERKPNRHVEFAFSRKNRKGK